MGHLLAVDSDFTLEHGFGSIEVAGQGASLHWLVRHLSAADDAWELYSEVISSGAAADLGDVLLASDVSPNDGNFEVSIKNGFGAGAVDVASIVLDDAGPSRLSLTEANRDGRGRSGLTRHASHPAAGGDLGALPRMDRQGNVSFVGFIGGNNGSPAALVQAIFKTVSGLPQVISKQTESAPGTDGTFSGFPSFIASAPQIHQGKTSFRATASGTPTDNLGLWSDRFGELGLVLLDEDHLPGMPEGDTMVQFVFATGASTIFANVNYGNGGSIPHANEGLWRNVSGSWELILVNGMPAPGLPAGVVFGDDPLAAFGPLWSWTINPDDEVMAIAFLNGPNVSSTNDESIWFEGDNGLELLVREGDPVPGLVEGTIFGPELSFPVFGAGGDNVPPVKNENGSILFGAALTGPLEALFSVWTTRSGEMELLLLGAFPWVGYGEGDQAPGFPPGVNFVRFLQGEINNNDEIALQAFVLSDDPVDPTEGIWWDRFGEFSLLAAEQQAVPGVPNAVFTDLLPFTFNDDSILLYGATFAGPGVNSSNDFALFRVDPDGTTHIVLRTGDLVEIEDDQGGSEIRQVSFQFGVGPGMSASGERVFEVFFVDGSSGIYTANVLGAGQPSPADLNGDGMVGAFDLALLLGSWGPCADCQECPADLNGDCTVGAADLAILLGSWG